MDDYRHDIERYLSGKMTPAEMHALEKRALDDPFLLDALEGGASVSPPVFTADIQELEARLDEKLQKGKVIPLWIWAARIAAGFLIIALGTFIVINTFKADKPTDQQIASSEKPVVQPEGKEKPNAVASEAPPVVQESKPAIDKQSAKAKPAGRVKEPSAAPSLGEAEEDQNDAEAKPLANTESATIEAPTPAAGDAYTQPSEAKQEIAAPSTSTSPGFIAMDRNSGNTALESKKFSYSQAGDTAVILHGRVAGVNVSKAAAPRTVTGRIVSTEDGSPLPGVNVVIKGTSTGTVTNIDGYYQLQFEDPNTTLVYSFIGLTSTERAVTNSPQLDVEMSQDVSQLSEVVVTGYGTTDDVMLDKNIYSTFEMAEPVGGKKAFKKYLQENVVYPQVALENKVEGKVTIQFTVETTGLLSEFKVLKGIGYGCDDEVIRLIKSGPKWSASKRESEPVKGKVKVRMRFALPKKK